MIKFRTFYPQVDYEDHRLSLSATYLLTVWLEENPDVELISWQAVSVGGPSDICIVVQYKENK